MKLVQRINWFGGKLSMYIDSGDTLIIEVNRVYQKHISRHSLDSLDTKFETYRSFSLFSYFFTLVSFGVTLWLAKLGYEDYQSAGTNNMLITSACFAILTIGAFAKALASTVNLVTFCNLNGVKAYSFYGNRPGKEHVDRFCKYLVSNIESIRYEGGISEERMKSILLKHLEFLSSKGVVSDVEFDSISAKIAKNQKDKIVKLVSKQ